MTEFQVITGEFFHETNSFSKVFTTKQSFHERTVFFGESAIAERANATTELAGFIDCAKNFGWNVTHSVSAFATPAGIVTSDTYEYFCSAILDTIRKAERIDGILLAMHGSMVAEMHPDADGETLRRIRECVGPDVPIGITLDLHANVSALMCDCANIIVSYKTYPHIDMRNAGNHAGRLLHETMKKTIQPITIRAWRPMLEEANSGRTDVGPMIERFAMVKQYETIPGVCAVSINAGFPTDIDAYVGPTVLCTYDCLTSADESPHRAFIESIADDIWAKRNDVINSFYSVEEAAAIALEHLRQKSKPAAGPFVIADYADNPGAGSYGDATNLLAELLKHSDIRNAAFVPVVDPAAVSYICNNYIVGERIVPNKAVHFGGKVDPRFGGGPLTAIYGTILHISDGVFVGNGPMIGGLTLSFGKTVVIDVEDRIQVLLVTDVHQILDLSQLTTFGIDPLTKDVIVVKSMQHFRAVFEPISSKIIVCDSGALATPDLRKLLFSKVQRPIFPLDNIN